MCAWASQHHCHHPQVWVPPAYPSRSVVEAALLTGAAPPLPGSPESLAGASVLDKQAMAAAAAFAGKPWFRPAVADEAFVPTEEESVAGVVKCVPLFRSGHWCFAQFGGRNKQRP